MKCCDLCRVEKQVNGLQNHTESETDKTGSDEDDNDGKTSEKQRKKPTANSNDDDSDGDDSGDDVVPVTEPRPAKVIAGEVIKQWQTKTRSKGFSVASLPFISRTSS